MSSRPPRQTALAVVLVALLSTTAVLAAAPSIKDEMRLPYARDPAFLRTWLICGPFPSPPVSGTTGPRRGLTTDYLGGEAAARPADGQVQPLPAGGETKWFAHTAPGNKVGFRQLFTSQGKPAEQVVAYAHTTVTRPAEEQTVISVGSDDGVRLWVNGELVLDHAIDRAAQPDQELVPVTLRAGENRLLVKVDQGAGDWGFYLRVLKPGEARLLDQQRLSPSLSPEADANTFVIATDTTAAAVARPPVRVEVLAPGGRIVAADRVLRGEPVRFPASGWAEGPYEAVLTMALPDRREKIAYVPWYRGDAQAAAARVVATAKAMDRTQPFSATYAMLGDMIVDRLGGDPATASKAQLPLIYDQLMEVAELAQAHAGGIGGAHAHGMVRLAYVDDVDGSAQWCRAYLPANYDPQRKWPMVVVLHGYNGPNPPYIKWWSAADRHDRFADLYDTIIIHPMGRYNTGYNGIGDRDVVRAIELAKRRFSVDEDRVSLMGYSMGGGGTWHVGTRHPDLFASLVPIYGGFDYRFFIPEDIIAKLGPWERLRLEKDSSFSQAEQLLNLPIWIIHGDADQTVDVAHSRYAVRMLQHWGYDVRYWEVPGLGHEDPGELREPFQWMLAQRRNARPQHVRVRAGDLTYAAAYWVRVTQRDDPMAFIAADAEFTGPNALRLDTDNALEVVLTPPPPLVDPAQPLRVVWNGEERTVPLDGQGRVVLRAADYAPSGLVKTPAADGPLSDFETTPFAIVQGTISPDPMMRRLCEQQAQRAVRDWETYQHARPRLFRDTEISDEDLTRYSLALIGGPADNAISRRLSDQLPLRVSANEIAIDGRAFPVHDAVVRMIYLHPLNPARYVVVLAATSPAGLYLAGSFPDLANAVDFCIMDGRIPDAGQGRPEEQVLPAMGVFGPDWKLDSRGLVVGDAKVRAECPVRTAPARLTADIKGDQLWLAELLEASADGQFARMRRNTSWTGPAMVLNGKRYPKGIAVNTWDGPNGADFGIAGAWQRLRGLIGLECDAEAPQPAKDSTHVVFIVKGDGKELYRSPEFTPTSKPVALDVDVTGVKTLRLEVGVAASSMDAVASADWADLRLER
jgi:predicted esterase